MRCTLSTNCKHITRYYWCWEQCLTGDFTSYVYGFNPPFPPSSWIHPSNNPAVALPLCADVRHLTSLVQLCDQSFLSIHEITCESARLWMPFDVVPCKCMPCVRHNEHYTKYTRHGTILKHFHWSETYMQKVHKPIHFFKGEARLDFTQQDISM